MTLEDGNPMTRTLQLTLFFEVVVCVLAIPGMIQVSDVPLAPAFGFGLAAAVLAGVAGGLLGRRPVGWPLGWLAQVAAVALGFLTPWMFGVGGGFALLYAVEFVLGRRLQARQ